MTSVLTSGGLDAVFVESDGNTGGESGVSEQPEFVVQCRVLSPSFGHRSTLVAPAGFKCA